MIFDYIPRGYHSIYVKDGDRYKEYKRIKHFFKKDEFKLLREMSVKIKMFHKKVSLSELERKHINLRLKLISFGNRNGLKREKLILRTSKINTDNDFRFYSEGLLLYLC